MENVEGAVGAHHHGNPNSRMIEVAVYTTSGAFPEHGHRMAKGTDLVNEILSKAAKALHLADTSGWVATVDGQEIDTSKSYVENNLAGTVTIHWGPREGGGGR